MPGPAYVESVNLGVAREVRGAGRSGIDKRPVAHRVAVSAPGPKGSAGSGLAGDAVLDLEHHGGDDQAIYAYAREHLDAWSDALGPLRSGSFGENLTTSGIDLTACRIGERWRVGPDLVVQVTKPRLPCNTFARFMGERGWLRRFTERGEPGAYLRVLEPGTVGAGDAVEVLAVPAHGVTIGLVFRAQTTEPHRLGEIAAAGPDLPADLVRALERRQLAPGGEG